MLTSPLRHRVNAAIAFKPWRGGRIEKMCLDEVHRMDANEPCILNKFGLEAKIAAEYPPHQVPPHRGEIMKWMLSKSKWCPEPGSEVEAICLEEVRRKVAKEVCVLDRYGLRAKINAQLPKAKEAPPADFIMKWIDKQVVIVVVVVVVVVVVAASTSRHIMTIKMAASLC
jgi:hypothetical protein